MRSRSVVSIAIAVVFLLSANVFSLAAAPVSKAFAPDEEAQAHATKAVQEIFAAEWSAAKTTSQKQALVKKLLQNGRETKNDLAGQFVLLRLAKDMAIQAADLDLAFEAIAQLDRIFQVDVLEMKAEALAKIAPAVKSVDQQNAIVRNVVEVADEAMLAARYDIARQMNELETSAARQTGDGALVMKSTQRKIDIQRRGEAFAALSAASEILKKSPTDPDANLAAGKYYCFAEFDWPGGLPMLAQGSDSALKAIAQAELKDAGANRESIKLGDLWWDYAEKNAANKSDIQLHAADLYRQALPTTTGITHDRIQQRSKQYPPRADARQKFLPPDAVIKLFNLPAGKWKIEDATLIGVVGNIDNDGGNFWTKEMSGSDFEFGYSVKSKAYQAIGAQVDDVIFRYSRGHWHNKNAGVLNASHVGKDLRIEGTVESPDKWVSLVAKTNGNNIEYLYDGKLARTDPLPSNSSGKRTIKLEFGGHDSTIAVKDFYVLVK